MAAPPDVAQRLLDETDPERSWRLFLETYLGTIDRAVRRSPLDEDEAGDVAAEVARRIHADWPALLEAYRAACARTPAGFRLWLAVVARNLATDIVRERRGRSMVPRPITRLAGWKQALWRGVYLAGRDLTEVRLELSRPSDEVADAIQEIEAALAIGARARLRARVRGGIGQVGEVQPSVPDPATGPDQEPGVQAARDRVHGAAHEILEELSPDERSLLRIYFLQEATAQEVAPLVGASGPRQVYERVRVLIARLRTSFEERGLEPSDMDHLADFDWETPLDGGREDAS